MPGALDWTTPRGASESVVATRRSRGGGVRPFRCPRGYLADQTREVEMVFPAVVFRNVSDVSLNEIPPGKPRTATDPKDRVPGTAVPISWRRIWFAVHINVGMAAGTSDPARWCSRLTP